MKTKQYLVIIAIVFSISASSAAGILAVANGIDRTKGTCEAVQGVRDDLVTALRRIEHRALKGAKTEADKKAVREGYEGKEGLITEIGDPTCP